MKMTDETPDSYSVLFQTTVLLFAVPFLLVIVIPLPHRHVSFSEFVLFFSLFSL